VNEAAQTSIVNCTPVEPFHTNVYPVFVTVLVVVVRLSYSHAVPSADGSPGCVPLHTVFNACRSGGDPGLIKVTV
jgi:hypothetical protein